MRRLCDCAQSETSPDDRLGLDVSRCRAPRGCERCGQTGYSGRLLLAESLNPRLPEVGRAILGRSDTDALQQVAVAAGMRTILQRAMEAVEAGRTSSAEVRRVLGPV